MPDRIKASYLSRMASDALYRHPGYGEGHRLRLVASLALPGLVVGLAAAFLRKEIVLDTVQVILLGTGGSLLWNVAVFLWNFLKAPERMESAAATTAKETKAEMNRRLVAATDELAAVRASLEPTFHLEPESINELGYQRASAFLVVKNLGEGEAVNCRGRLIRLGRRTLDIPLAWAQPDDPTQPNVKSFYGSARLNVAVEAGPNFMAPAAAHVLDGIDSRAGSIDRDVDWTLEIEIKADGSPPTIGTFRLKWWSHIVIKDQATGQDVYYSLHGANVKFETVGDE